MLGRYAGVTSGALLDLDKLVTCLAAVLDPAVTLLGRLQADRGICPNPVDFRRSHEGFARFIFALLDPLSLCVSALQYYSPERHARLSCPVYAAVNDGTTYAEPVAESEPRLRQWLCNQVSMREASAISRHIFSWHENHASSFPLLCLLPHQQSSARGGASFAWTDLAQGEPQVLTLGGALPPMAPLGDDFEMEHCVLLGIGLSGTEQIQPAVRILSLLWMAYRLSSSAEMLSEKQAQFQAQLHRWRNELDSFRADAAIFHRIVPHLKMIRLGYRNLNEPFSSLDRNLFTMSSFIPRLDQLSNLFNDRMRNELNQELNIEGIHVYPEPVTELDTDWERTRPLCAAALLRMLQLPIRSTNADGLWGELQGYLHGQETVVQSSLKKALQRHLKEAFEANIDADQSRRLFRRLKNWLHGARKRNTADMPQALDLSLLLFALDCSGVDCERPPEISENTMIWVGSEQPINTVDAIDIMHSTWRLSSARVEITSQSVRLELEYSRPCYEGELNWVELQKNVRMIAAYQERPLEAHFSLGNLTRLLGFILGPGEIQLTERRLYRDDPIGSVGLEWITPQKVCIEWTLFPNED